jgi:beta-galactosidase
MREAGLHAVQIWVTWAWVESEPGVYSFGDYDALFDEAERHGLGVIVSTLGELQPEWIHRLVPDGAMVDHLGREVISSHRIESNAGLTPGACTDHPEVARRMGGFLRATARHFRERSGLVLWDIWNELRWNIHCDGYVCHCAHTLAAFRAWLRTRHGDLAGLDRAWHRRYADWADVMPGKVPGRPYTEQMAFATFLQERAEAHLRWRAEIFRAEGGGKPVFAHGQTSTIDQIGSPTVFQQAVCRGNDWEHVKALDGYGVSHFPLWGAQDDTAFMLRVESSAAAAGEKPMWLSELQGGAANYGHAIARPVSAALQQRWLWMGMAAGAKGVIFWSWTDEVFGREATGFGLAGRDGCAEERIAALARLRVVVDRERQTLADYRPDPARVGVFFSAPTYHLETAEAGMAAKARDGIHGWLRACMRARHPATVLEGGSLGGLDALELLVLPGASVVPEAAVAPILAWVRAGGTLVVEADVEAWSTEGFYRAEPADRPLLHALGIAFVGRSPLEEASANLSWGEAGPVIRTGWFLTPLAEPRNETDGAVRARDAHGRALGLERRVERGRVIALGTFAGLAYETDKATTFETWVAHLCGGGASAGPVTDAPASVLWRSGRAGAKRLVFLVNGDESAPAAVRVRLPSAGAPREWLRDAHWTLDADGFWRGEVPAGGVAVIESEAAFT